MVRLSRQIQFPFIIAGTHAAFDRTHCVSAEPTELPGKKSDSPFAKERCDMKYLVLAACLPIVFLCSCTTPINVSTDTESGTAANSPEGTWRITKCSFYGEDAAARIGDNMVIATSGQSTIERAGTPLPIAFTFQPSGILNQFDISFETSEDKLSAGGGGPCLGLLRLTENGDMEMLVAGSATDDRPTDFSSDQMNSAIYYSATPQLD